MALCARSERLAGGGFNVNKGIRKVEMGVKRTFAVSREVIGVTWGERLAQRNVEIPPDPEPRGFTMKTAATNLLYHGNWACLPVCPGGRGCDYGF